MSKIREFFHPAAGSGGKRPCEHWLDVSLSPKTDKVRLFEDLAVTHRLKYSLRLPESDPGFTFLVWFGSDVCICGCW